MPFMARCTWYNIMWSSLSVTCCRSVVFFWYFGFLHQNNWLPLYSWNIVESGIEYHNPNSMFCDKNKMIDIYFTSSINSLDFGNTVLFKIIFFSILFQSAATQQMAPKTNSTNPFLWWSRSIKEFDVKSRVLFVVMTTQWWQLEEWRYIDVLIFYNKLSKSRLKILLSIILVNLYNY